MRTDLYRPSWALQSQLFLSASNTGLALGMIVSILLFSRLNDNTARSATSIGSFGKISLWRVTTSAVFIR